MGNNRTARSHTLDAATYGYIEDALRCLRKNESGVLLPNVVYDIETQAFANAKAIKDSDTSLAGWFSIYSQETDKDIAREIFWGRSTITGSTHLSQLVYKLIAKNSHLYLDEWGLPVTHEHS